MPGSTTSRLTSSAPARNSVRPSGRCRPRPTCTGRVQQKAAETKDHISEKASETKDVVVEKADAAQSAARDAVTDSTGSVKPRVPIAALTAAAAILAIGVAVWSAPPMIQHQRERTATSRPQCPSRWESSVARRSWLNRLLVMLGGQHSWRLDRLRGRGCANNNPLAVQNSPIALVATFFEPSRARRPCRGYRRRFS